MVPEGWSEKTFNDLLDAGDLASIQDGNHGDIHPKAADFVPDGVPFVMARDLKGGTIGFSGCSFISQVQADSLRIGHAYPGDVLISHKGTIGNVAVVPDAYEMVILTPQVTLYRTSSGGRIDSKYLRAFLQSERYQARFLALAFQSTRNYLGITQQKKFSVPLPPLPEQRKIADILSTWDAAIEKTEALLATAKAQKRALMQSLLTGKRRFPEFEGQPWKEVRLGDVATIAMGSSPKSAAYNDDGVGLPLIQGNADVKNGRSAPRTFTSEITTRCAPGDILLSVRAPVGSVAISDHEACVGRGGAVIRPIEGHSWLWLKHLMLWLEPQWARVSQGSTFEAVNSKDIKTFLIPLPSSQSEEDALGNAIETAHLECSALVGQIAKLRTEKKALMQQLLTGKRRVTVEEHHGI
tara:strand:- start:5652 stop:6881 length:1230 start_codon:yes stop_codon:yes gene_type:complete